MKARLMRKGHSLYYSIIETHTSYIDNSAKIIIPRSWLRKRVIAFLPSGFISKPAEEWRKDCGIIVSMKIQMIYFQIWLGLRIDIGTLQRRMIIVRCQQGYNGSIL